jgi:hypothetical protein
VSRRRQARWRGAAGRSARPFSLGAALAKLVVAVLLPLLGAGYAVAAWRLAESAWPAPGHLLPFAIGAAACVPLWIAARRVGGLAAPLEFFMTLEHELTHLIVGLLFLKRPHSLRASATGHGEVVLYGDNFVILLAPYFLPTISLALMPLPLVLRGELLAGYFALLGLTVGYHVLSTVHELSPRQTDIARSGFAFSALFLPVANLVCYCSLVAFAVDGYPGAWRFLRDGAETALGLVARLVP